jgi:hypothetical protein
MGAAESPEIFYVVDEPPGASSVGVSLRTSGGEGAKVPEKILVSRCCLPYLLLQRGRERQIGEGRQQHRIVRATNDAQRRDDPSHHLVVRECLPSRHSARDSGTDEPLLEVASHPPVTVQERIVAPAGFGGCTVGQDVVDQPAGLRFLILETVSHHLESRLEGAIDLLLEKHRIAGDQTPRRFEDLDGATPVLVQ